MHQRVHIWVMVLSLLWAACTLEQTAGTEVGNPPSMEVLAKFSVDQGANAPVITHFRLMTSGMMYHTMKGEEDTLWESSEGIWVDLIGKGGTDTLPVTHVEDFDWMYAKIMLWAPRDPSPLNPDTLNLEAFSQSGYVCARISRSEAPLDILFALPGDLDIDLTFNRDMFGDLDQNTRVIDVVFNCRRWLGSIDWSGAQSFRDVHGREGIYLSSTHNKDIYRKMLGLLAGSFNASSVSVNTLLLE